jgi:hypothetical protein
MPSLARARLAMVSPARGGIRRGAARALLGRATAMSQSRQAHRPNTRL